MKADYENCTNTIK